MPGGVREDMGSRCSRRIVARHDPVPAHRIVADRDLAVHDINYLKNQEK
ncbi:hypothetical protein DER30_7303 [Streptomyces sp. HB202]|nr:hypothetical protein DER30_7303 [Streptomyces sp. HB202]